MFTDIFKLALSLAPDQSWPTYDGLELDRSEFLTSSETASCLRMAFFKKYPDKYKAKIGSGGINGYAERGHAIEHWLVGKLAALKKLGYKFEYLGADQRSFYNADNGTSGTPDGIMTAPDGKIYLLEFKSIDPRANKNYLPRKKHIWQVQQNMALVQDCLGIKLEGAVLFYIDASNLYETREFSITYDGELVEEMIERAHMLWEAKVPDDLPPDGVYSEECDLCPFTQYCSQTVKLQNEIAKMKEKPTPFLDASGVSLNDEQLMHVEQWFDAYDGMKTYETQKDEVHKKVQKLVIDNHGYIEYDGRGIVGRMQAGRTSLDTASMAADGIDVSKYQHVGAPFVVLTVKAK